MLHVASTGILTGAYIVSGGASGLGAAVADAIAGNGGTPEVFDLKASEAEHAFHRVDVSDAQSLEREVAAVAAAHGGLSGVVACAGIDACGRIEDVPFAAWERVIRVNLIGTAALARAALPYLPSDGSGRIVTVASTLGIAGPQRCVGLLCE